MKNFPSKIEVSGDISLNCIQLWELISNFIWASSFLLSLFLCSSCKKNEQPIDQLIPVDTSNVSQPSHIINFGHASLFASGSPWDNKYDLMLCGYYSDHLRFEFSAVRGNAYRRDFFSIEDIPCAKGIYPIIYNPNLNKDHSTPWGHYGILVYVDEPTGTYYPDGDKKPDNFVEVINYNATDSTVEGRFQVYLKHDTTVNAPIISVPDKIAITEGKFFLKLQ